MTPCSLLRMLRQRWRWLLLGPLAAALLVLFATRNAPDEYVSEIILNTGLVSGYTIESTGDDQVDYLTVANAFDNLVALVKARTTVEESALRLLARQLAEDSARLQVFDAARARAIRRIAEGTDSEARIAERLRAARHRPNSVVHELLFEGETPFAVDEIHEGLSVSRVAASDLLAMRYVSIDPLLCQRTLEVLLEVVTERHQGMRTRETGSVVAYFEREVTRAREDLRERVDALRGFGVDNRVINYDEQTKAIAGQKEAIEAQLQQERQRKAAAEAVLAELEARMAQQQALAVQSDTVLTLRSRLAEVATALTLAEATGPPRLDLRRERVRLEATLADHVADLYDLSTSREGLNRENIAAAWLQKLLEATEARAQVALLEQRLADYVGYYDEFSPLGDTLAMLEREVDTAERTYLELLNSLNQARMREQNIQLTSRLDVVDAPSFPNEPEASPRPMLTLGALMGCLGLLLTLFALVEVLHPTLRSVERACAITGLEVATAYPPISAQQRRGLLGRLPSGRLPSGRLLSARLPLRRLRWKGLLRKTDPLEPPAAAPPLQDHDDLHEMLEVLDLHLTRAVKLRLLDRPSPDDASLRIAVVGALPEDGAALIATRLAMLLRDEYDRVLHVALTTRTGADQAPVPDDLLGPGFATDVARVVVSALRTYDEAQREAPLAPHPTALLEADASGAPDPDDPGADPSPQVTVLELPPLVQHAAPLRAVRDADLALVVLRANRAWTDADQHALQALKAAHEQPPLLVLTETHCDFLNGLTARSLPIPPVLRPLFG